MQYIRHIMRQGVQRLQRALRSPKSPREQVIEALDDTLKSHAHYAQNAVVLLAEIDEQQTLHRDHSVHDMAQILSILEQRLKGGLLSRDMVRRLEGGQFAIVISPIHAHTQEEILLVAGQIQHLFTAPIALNGLHAQVTTSIGCAMSKTETLKTGTDMLEAARMAQMEASAKGPAGLRFYIPQMGEKARVRREFGKDAEEAMHSGAIQAFFQPQISLLTQEVSGFEALARWLHPDRGIIPPVEFLPVLEEAGLMRLLGQKMLRDSLTALKTWDELGLKVPQVSVNMCGEELRHPNIAADIHKQLTHFGIAPQRLVIEVLETVYIGSLHDPIIHNINEIARLGCHIDLDDFGTGHTSIKSVRNFAVNRIKIDRSFIVDIDRDPEQQEIVKTILSVAKNLSVDTLAEGVETDAEVRHLAQSGCGHAQGYVIARPLPFDETQAWVKSRRLPHLSAHQGQRMQ